MVMKQAEYGVIKCFMKVKRGQKRSKEVKRAKTPNLIVF